MGGSATDSQLRQVASGPLPATISDLLTPLQRIYNLLPSGDGLKWFNLLKKASNRPDLHAIPAPGSNPRLAFHLATCNQIEYDCTRNENTSNL